MGLMNFEEFSRNFDAIIKYVGMRSINCIMLVSLNGIELRVVVIGI